MSNEGFAYGYIKLVGDHVDENIFVLRNTSDDEHLMPSGLFVAPIQAYDGMTVSFAINRNHLHDYAPTWLAAFEQLLLSLRATEAIVRIETEADAPICIRYTRYGGTRSPTKDLPPEQQRWSREERSRDGTIIKDTYFTLVNGSIADVASPFAVSGN